ncbi:MAG: peptidoglycan-binding domain-containing protein [Rhodospirillales bacterium]|nr:peptidoglycan-binding domain-containing protein [Rhodospirillales bacterium]
MTMSETGLAVRVVQWALIDLDFDMPEYGADGKYGQETYDRVRDYKASRGLATDDGVIDGVVGMKTMNQLDREPLPTMAELELRYSDRMSNYQNRALVRANSSAHPDWDPDAGFAHNRARIIDLYGYYRDLYLLAPLNFLWAGLGRMAGGPVVGGLDGDPGFIAQNVMVRIGRDIFYDLAWLHEAFLDHPSEAVKLGHLHDRFNRHPTYFGGSPGWVHAFPPRSYGAAWHKITVGRVGEGNRELLQNEQWSIIQPHYDWLLTGLLSFSGLISPFTNNVHPYHRAFSAEMPGGNVLVAGDRWNWITRTDGMLQRWWDIGLAERTRLASLPFNDICSGRFGTPGRPELLPPGG